MTLKEFLLHCIYNRHPELRGITDFDLLAALLATLGDWDMIHATRVVLNLLGETMSLWVYAADLHRKPQQ